MAKSSREKERVRENLNFIRTHKNRPCTDCGIQYHHAVMQFDHLRDKLFQLSDPKLRPKHKIIAEIAKCEVVCANCHTMRTYNRRQNSGDTQSAIDTTKRQWLLFEV